MLQPQSGLRSTPALTGTCDHAGRQLTASLRYSSSSSTSPITFASRLGFRHLHQPKLILISCKSSESKSNNENSNDYSDHDYLQASVLLSETVRHHRMLMQGFRDETIWQSSAQNLFPFSSQTKDSRTNVGSIGSGFLRRFQSPTIFLKSSCDGDYVLPIIVGEFAVEKLITDDESWACPNQYQFINDLVDKLCYKVMMVRITERVLSTYFARIIFSKPGENDILSVDARPSDAINVANRCKAPIYVNKQIVLTDGIRISFGMGRVGDSKSTYDVSLDSAADGPDLFAEELELMHNMNLAVKEERYQDAALWREKLMKLRDSWHGY